MTTLPKPNSGSKTKVSPPASWGISKTIGPRFTCPPSKVPSTGERMADHVAGWMV